ncbi:MAG: EAL domain-containing protein [Planctomycetota bacterium]|jgi:diguanylate cyclase (GGDEF)-like protein|nr:EAL domain-containing protein [Planctomycetota bacterium]
MKKSARALTAKDIAEQIIENSPAIAMRASCEAGGWAMQFITKNITGYGYAHGDFMSGRVTWMDIIHPEDRPDVINLMAGFEEMGNDSFTLIYRILRADGSFLWVSDAMTVTRDEQGRVAYYDCIVLDYTETKAHIDRIGENLRQQAVLDEILQGLHAAELDQALGIILGRTGEFLELSRITLFKNGPDNDECRAIHEWCAKDVPSMLENGEYRLNYLKDIPEIAADLAEHGRRVVNPGMCPKGCAAAFARAGAFAAAAYAVRIHDEPFGFICFEECRSRRTWDRDRIRFLDNVSRLVAPAIFRQRNDRIIQSLAMTDQLTGLHNRHYLETYLAKAIERARAEGTSGYVLFIDMDDFKVINDAYGHDYGDAILKEIAVFLRQHFGDARNIFRFGGDEFVILLEPDKSSRIYEIMGGLLQRARLPWQAIDRNFYCTLSVGVVRYPDGCGGGREIIKNADIAMYQAKKMGKNNYVFYTRALDSDTLARAEMEIAMRAGIKTGFDGFSVRYQPLTDMDANIIGAEALLRWTVDGKPIAPDQFIPLAEYLGLIIPLGEYVLRSAADLCGRINRFRPDFFVSVNVSIRQFRQQEFMATLLGILDESGASLSNIALEITEGMAIHDMQRMKVLGSELRQRGMRIAMDDFGTGYSSLGNMRELPIDVVKIDRSFIHDVTTDAYSESFVRLISDLVHSMGRKVCIEGVETAAQYRFCRECGADYAQGYYLWRPLPEEELLAALAGSGEAAAREA